MTDRQLQQDYYNTVADRYDSFDNFGIHRENRNHFKKLALIEDQIALEGDETVLEVGCGTGIHAERLVAGHPKVRYIGLDVSRGMLKQAAARVDATSLVEADAQNLPIATDGVDVVIGTAVLHHLERQTKTLAEFYRVIRPGGHLVLMEPNILFPKDFVMSIVKAEERHKFKIRARALRRRLAKAGFDQYRVAHRIFTPPWPKRWHDHYDRIDAICGAIPVVRKVSMMIEISAHVPDPPEGDGC